MSVDRVKYRWRLISDNSSAVRSSSRYLGRFAIEKTSILFEKDVVLNSESPSPKLYTMAMGTNSRLNARNRVNSPQRYLWKRMRPRGLISPFLPRYFYKNYSY